ncbi:MAG: hypothetical protein CMC76_08310 [Flavobacteriaceae bacterium]|nr:hypothetical protein [Flavobacteriaceae bacterium]
MEETIVKLKFCTLTFFDNYVIAVINEGEHVDHQINQKLINIMDEHYERPYVYITHRIHSYSVDPHIYPKTTTTKNLAGFAVVSDDYISKNNAKIERLFFGKPFEIFSVLDDAITWAKDLTKKAS